MDKIQIASSILSGLKKTVYCAGFYYYYKGTHYAELTDLDINKLVRAYFIANHMTNQWSNSVTKDIQVAIKLEISEKDDVDLMDNYDHYIPILNGIVDMTDLNSITVIPHNPEYLFTFVIPVTWEPNIEYTMPLVFLEFLRNTFMNTDGTRNKELSETVTYVMAYLIYPSIMMEKMFMFLGDGANGKSFLISIIKLFFKPEHVTSASLQTLSQDQTNNRDFLLKSRLNIAGEQKGIKIDPEEIKKIASGQDIQIILRYKGNFSFKPKTKLIVDSNNLPFFSDNTRGTKRRLYIIYFKNNFLEDDEYFEMQNRLCGSKNIEKIKNYDLSSHGLYRQKNSQNMLNEIKGEMNEIFALLMIYTKLLKERKWQLPKNAETDKAMAEYEEGTDFLKTWLLANYEIGEDIRNATMSANRLFVEFEDAYMDIHQKSSLYKKATITKRIKELFKLDGLRKSIKNPDGTYSTDTCFPIVPKLKFEQDE